MNERDWADANARYLAGAMAWVRSCLEGRVPPPAPTVLPSAIATVPDRAAPPPIAVPASTPAPAPVPRSAFGFLQRQPRIAAPPALPELAAPAEPPKLAAGESSAPPPAQPLPPNFEDLAADMQPPPALQFLAQRLDLSEFERNVLLLCIATELDPAVPGLCAQVQGDPSLAYPTFALARALFADPDWAALSPDQPLRHWRLVEIAAAGSAPLSASPLRADERVVHFVNGITGLDDRLASFASALPVPMPSDAADADPLASSHRALVGQIFDLASQAAASPLVQLLGADTASKRAIAASVAQALGRQLYRLDASALPSAPGELDAFARLWQRESVLLPVALYVESDANDSTRGAVDLLLQRLDGLVFLATRQLRAGAGAGGTPLSFEVDKPTSEEQRGCWQAASGAITEEMAVKLSEQFDLDLASIRALALRETESTSTSGPLEDRLWDAARAVTRPSLDTLSRRIVSHAGWGDLVLPPAETALLHQITDQVAHRGRVYRDWGFAERMSRGLGITVLFAGASGTGKTLAAEVLANHLRLDLFRIDLSAVMSKYIGETEANLRRLFDAAEGGGAILFFDEADALFGKRTEVKDSHDRYANIEINYLLQRMESYAGLAVLATNMKSALDQAFMRRLRFVVDFPFPGVPEREAMWRKAFPANTPTEKLDFARLARLNLTGGYIAVIAVNAAFRAARADTAVTMPIVLDAARVEFRKLDRPVNEADFRWVEAVA